jgi:hypothetical protein
MGRRTAVLFAAFLTIVQGAFLYAEDATAAAASAQQPRKTLYSLNFDATNYTTKTQTVDGKAVTYRAFEGIVYVKNPVDAKYQSLNFYVPEAYYAGASISGYTATKAPIFFPNSVGGYMPGEPDQPGEGREGGPNAALVALSKGLVVACPGARGRTTQDASGAYTGKAPACIVDLKAAVRYLRYNDQAMPGDAEKIVSNGTSAGGALSALLGASGDSRDYEPYLKALGAADAADDIFAASCYCPITNLDNADSAYEWLFNGINDYKQIKMGMLDYHMERTEVAGSLTADQIQVSNKLAALFPAYLNSLKLKGADGKLLGLKADGSGSFQDYVESYVIASAQKALDGGKDLSALSWLTIKAGKVTALDFAQYLRYVGRMKTPPAFDGLDLSNGENGLFGTSSVDAKHFTAFGMANSTVPAGTIADKSIVKILNPMNYIGAKGVTTAKYWRIRHGTVDKDTSLAIPAILATTLANKGCSVDFALPWDRPHSGDYDLDELFAWIAQISR